METEKETIEFYQAEIRQLLGEASRIAEEAKKYISRLEDECDEIKDDSAKAESVKIAVDGLKEMSSKISKERLHSLSIFVKLKKAIFDGEQEVEPQNGSELLEDNPHEKK